MSLCNVEAGNDLPRQFNVVVEIPLNGDPIKYEIDKQSGAIVVDRFMSTAMRYPCNYGYIPQTLTEDGDPADVLLIAPFALQTGVVVQCRAIGLLNMEDEQGLDHKILAVPTSRLTRLYEKVEGPDDLPASLLEQIAHFFAHYKDLEHGKFVRVGGFENASVANAAIIRAVALFQAAPGAIPASLAKTEKAA